ncbi:hypothetical protein K7J14_15315 [Treponema zuelzerae]|uniref:Uncharacterized protein n=1 Tax=Teretinema zuelzerae TaxID=156 RepID=A0AAE3JK03_9SPIR|nr:hypothetical protein [Teretinema zuelzerae]MCD1656068.1 hypothetical protein [Teretinema zuelzerae]
MEKPKRSFIVYIISLIIFIVYSVLTRGMRLRSSEYFKLNNEPYYFNNLIIFLTLALTFALIVNLVRYNKVVFLITSIIIFLNVLYQIVNILVLTTEPHSISVWISRTVFIVVNILIGFFLINKQTLTRCDEFKQYYQEKRVAKEALRRLKRN